MDANSLCARVSRTFFAPAERVFDAWLDPAMVQRWMFGPAVRDEEVVRISIDARVGGTFSFVVRRQGQLIDHIGLYREMDRPRRLVFTWAVAPDAADTSRVSIDIVPLGRGCELALVHELAPGWAEFVERTQNSWSKMLDSLAKALG